MTPSHLLPIIAIGTACAFTGLVLAFVLRAQRLNRADRCGLCGDRLGLEARYRFHGRTVCESCSRRVRFITLPRVARITVLLAAWGVGVAALVTLIQQHDPEALVWGPLFGALVAGAVLAGAVPPLTRSRDHTGATLRRLYALLQADRERSSGMGGK